MKHFFIVILLLTTFMAYAKPRYNHVKIENDVQAIVNKHDPNINIGIVVHSKKHNRIIYDLNAERAYVPASTLKVLTAIGGLIYLGEHYRFETGLYYDSNKVKQGRLKGDLYIKFSGDPEFTKMQIEHLITKLHKQGIRRIEGRVYVDPSRFSGKPFGPGWMWDDQQSCYSAPLSAVILNRNCAAFVIETYKNRKLADIKNNMGLNVESTLRRANNSNCIYSVSSSRRNDYHFSGCILPGKHVLEISIKNPEQYASYYLESVFKKSHIQIHKPIKIKSVPRLLKPQIIHRSPTLFSLTKTMLKDSDNLIADSLLKTIGAEYFHQPGNWRNGVKALKKIVKKKLGVDLKKSMIVDGAGLSRYNLIRPTQLVQLLAKMRAYPRQLHALKQSLSIGGKDGTLKYRFRNSTSDIYAKTGTMNGVTSLAGYIETPQKDMLSFAIMINGIVGKATQYKKLEEKLCRYFSSL